MAEPLSEFAIRMGRSSCLSANYAQVLVNRATSAHERYGDHMTLTLVEAQSLVLTYATVKAANPQGVSFDDILEFIAAFRAMATS